MSVVVQQNPADSVAPISFETCGLRDVDISPILSQHVYDGVDMYVKDETVHRHGNSVKARMVADSVSKACDSGLPGICETTSGSTGIALASMCKGRMRCRIYVPWTTEPGKIDAMKKVNPDIDIVIGQQGETLDELQVTAKGFACENGYLYLDQFMNPNMLDGFNGFAAELISQVRKVNKKYVVIMAAGTGASLVGITRDFLAMGLDVDARVAVLGDSPPLGGTTPLGFQNHLKQAPWIKTIEVQSAMMEATWQGLVQGGYEVGPTSALNVAACGQYVIENVVPPETAIITIFVDPLHRYRGIKLYDKVFAE